jgi:rhomboid protease GluP
MSAGDPRNPHAPFPVPAATGRSCRVTLLCVLAAAFVFLAAESFDESHPGDRLGGKERYGALSMLRMSQESELRGMFQLWGDRWYTGDWWRLLTTGFHHVGLLHLLMNGFALIYLGRLLEPRLGSVKFLLVFFTAIVVANIPDTVMGVSGVGLSGGIYALFGMLLPLRKTDGAVAARLDDNVVLLVLLWIPVGVLLTLSDVMQLGNAAHLTGLIYGWLAGRAVFSPPGERGRFTPRVFVASHALLVPVLLLAVNPVWNARYQWYRATQARDDDLRIRRLRIAVSLDPQLAGAWRYLAEFQRREHSDDEKWRTIFEAVKFCPTDVKTMALVNHWWFHTSPADRERALAALRSIFPDEEWQRRRQFGLFNPPTVPPYRPLRRYLARVRVNPPLPFVLRGPDLFWPPVDGRRVATPQPLQAPSINPNRPDSAALGRRL